MTPGSASARVPYDEFGMFSENAAEYGIPYVGPPVVRREAVSLDDDRQLSALVWGNGDPEMVFCAGTHTDCIRMHYGDFADLANPTVGSFSAPRHES